jgi:hypothetical protein
MLGGLALAYIRRRQWEARLQAMETARAVGLLFGGHEDGAHPDGEYRGGERVVSGDEMFRMMGAG